MAIFAVSRSKGSLNESEAIKIDMVKPIPAVKPAPKISFKLIFPGSEHHLYFTAIHEAAVIPNGFPISKPKPTPKPTVENNPETLSRDKTMAVLANAKTGRIKKFTGM